MLSHPLNKILGLFVCTILIMPLLTNARSSSLVIDNSNASGAYKVTFPKLYKPVSLTNGINWLKFIGRSKDSCHSGSLTVTSTKDSSQLCTVQYHIKCKRECVAWKHEKIWIVVFPKKECAKHQYILEEAYYSSVNASGIICSLKNEKHTLTVKNQ